MKSTQKLSRIVLFCAGLTTVALCPDLSQATPYASGITNESGTISFVLNEAANDVSVLFDNNTVTNDLGALASGFNSFSVGVHTNYSIVVTKAGAGSPVQISVDSTNNSYYGPRGVAVNKNPKTHNFGRIYVVNSSAGTGIAPAQAVGRGLYILNADTSDALGRFSTVSTGDAIWGSSGTYSPYKPFVGSDDKVYVGDGTGGYTGTPGGASVWMFDPDITVATPVLQWGLTETNFAGCISTPVITGSLATGDLNLYCNEWGYSSNSFYTYIYGYDVGGSLPYTGPAETNVVVGGDGIGAVDGVTSDLYRAPDGKFFALQERTYATGGNDALWVYDTNAVTYLWDGLTAAGGNQELGTGVDPFSGCYGVAVSPDDQYVALVHGSDGSFLLAKLTNGLPDVSTLTTNVTSLSGTARGIAFDAADNVYVVSGGNDRLRVFTLGLTTTATTYNDLTGTNGTFSLTFPSTTVSVVAITNLASQNGPIPGVFQISRSSTNSSVLDLPLTVTFTLTGTASSSGYTVLPAGLTAGVTNTIVLAAGQLSTNVSVVPVNDGVSGPTTTVILSLRGGGGYTTAIPNQDTVDIQNTGPQLLFVSSIVAPSMYNAFSNDYASFIITRWGDTNAASYTINNFSYAGTAIQGMDYTLPVSITFNPGDTTYTNYIYPLTGGQLPVDSSTNPYVGNKTAIIGIAAGSGYTAGTNTVALTIIDSATPTAKVLFADPLSNPNDATNWGVTSANNNMQASPIDNTIIFGYDLRNGDPGDYGAIPLPPNGSATALRVTVNKDGATGAAAGVNLYPTNLNFSGNYAVRFNMNIIEGSAASSTTEGPLFGINHSGHETNWWTGSGLISGWGPNNDENWDSDGIWYWDSADGGAGEGDYIEYSGLGGTNNNTGWEELGTITRASFVNAFKTNVFTSSGGPGLAANNSILNDYTANNWADVEIQQLNGVVTFSIDKTPIFTYTNATTFTNGTLMLGYNDPFSSVGGLDGAVYYSNLRVVSVGAVTTPLISQIALNNINSTVVINFTTTDGGLTASSFTVQSASVVAGPYSDVTTGETITSLGGGGFQAVVPQNGSTQFYRIKENN